MKTLVKKTVKAGNSSAVVLPRAWLNREVRVELIKKTPETILLDVIDILKENIDLKEVIGIYLTGSYARCEEDEMSDIDILVLTGNIDREMIREGIYNILIVSLGLLKHKLNQDLFPVGQMIREAKPLLNAEYINSVEVRVTRKNVRWYLETTKEKLKIIKEALEQEKDKKYASDVIAYTLVLRIRTIHIIKKILENKEYSKKEFERLIEKFSRGKTAYERYLAVKNNTGEEYGTSTDEAHELCTYLKRELKNVDMMVKE